MSVLRHYHTECKYIVYGNATTNIASNSVVEFGNVITKRGTPSITYSQTSPTTREADCYSYVRAHE